jgi:glycosyltransferase involved in cell wall biosynthesis
MKLLSIITINYNNSIGLQQTIESVVNQSYKDFEYIIVDGGSTDGSVDVIEKFAGQISNWVSEKDSGIFFGMNKGIRMVKGDYLLFVNSGDLLASNTILEEIAPQLHTEDIIYGDYEVVETDNTWIKKYPAKLTFSHFFHDSLPHTAGAFMKTSGFRNELAEYDVSLKVVSDWAWYVIALFRYNYTYKHIDKIIGIYDHTGNSAIYPDITVKEKKSVFEKEFPGIYAEISALLVYKTKYETISSSRFLTAWLKCKKLLKLST